MTKNRSLVPVIIRPYLVPYLYQEFSGVEAFYLGKNVKSIKISMTSVIGVFLRTLCKKTDAPIKASGYNLFLSVPSALGKKYNESSVYACECGRNTALYLPEELMEDVNNLFEEMMYVALFSYIDGALLRARLKSPSFFQQNEKGLIKTAINEFAEKYKLYDNGMLYHTLRRLYYDASNKNGSIDRLKKRRSKQQKTSSYTSTQSQFKFVEE